jgi:hypothetical protein
MRGDGRPETRAAAAVGAGRFFLIAVDVMAWPR